MTSSFGNIIGTQRDRLPDPVVQNYAQTEPNLEEAVNNRITENQADLKQFGDELAAIAELKSKNFFDNIAQLGTLVGQIGEIQQTREANREARETKKRFKEISKDTRKKVLEYEFRLENASQAEQENILLELSEDDPAALEFLKLIYFPDVEEIDFSETKDKFSRLSVSGYNTFIEDSAIYDKATKSEAELISDNGIELVLTKFYLELQRKNVDINSSQVQRYVNRVLLPKLIKERETALRTWNQGSLNRYTVKRNRKTDEDIIEAFNSSEEVTTTDETGATRTDIIYNGVFDAPKGEGGLLEIIMLRHGLRTKAEAMAYIMERLPSLRNRIDLGGLDYFKNGATFFDTATGQTVTGYANSKFSSPGTVQSNLNFFSRLESDLVQSDDELYQTIVQRHQQKFRDFKAANGGVVSDGQLLIFEKDFVDDLRVVGLRTDLMRPAFLTGDETSGQGTASYSSKVGVANNLKGKAEFEKGWKSFLKTNQDPFPELTPVQKLAIPSAEAELERLIEVEMTQNGATFDQAFKLHQPKVLQRLINGDFDISYDRLRGTSPSDIAADIDASKKNSSEWLDSDVTNSTFEKLALQKYVKLKDGFRGDFPDYLTKLGNAHGMTGRQYAIHRLRALGLLTENNNFAENPEDALKLSDEEKKFLYLNKNATKNLMLLNTKDDNRESEKEMLDALRIPGRTVEYFEGKGLVSSFLDNIGPGQTIRTVEEVYDLAKSGKATNFGIYGFTAEELIAAVDSGAISKDADFNEDTQSLMAVELVRVQANRSNSIMGAVTEADKDWRRLSDLNEVEKAAVLRFFPSLRNMPMNQFHNLQQDIALVYLNDVEKANKDLGLDKFIDENPSLEFLRTTDREGQKVKSPTNKLTQFIYASSDKRPGSKEAAKDNRQLLLRSFFKSKIKRGEEVPIEIRKALNFTRNTFNDKFDYLNYEKK